MNPQVPARQLKLQSKLRLLACVALSVLCLSLAGWRVVAHRAADGGQLSGMARVLNPDGTLKRGVEGSFDTTGYRLEYTASGAPRFVAQACSAPDWDAQFGLPNGTNGTVYALAVSGNSLFVGGAFSVAGNLTAHNLAKFDLLTNTWSTVGQGNGNGVNHRVSALALSGTTLYIGGSFTTANVGGTGGTPALTANYVASFETGTNTWGVLAQGNGNGVNANVSALLVSGSTLFVGGSFTTANAGGTGGTPALAANCIAKFDTASNTWGALLQGNGNGVNATVSALALSGDVLFLGGQFQVANAGGTGATPELTVSAIAKFDLQNNVWSTLGSGIGLTNWVSSMVVLDNSLYVGGGFSAVYTGPSTFMQVGHLARYDIPTNTWSAVAQGDGQGVSTAVWALAANGNDLYVGGFINTVNVGGTGSTPALPANNVAKFDTLNNTWSLLAQGSGNGVGDIAWALAVSGNQVFVGGSTHTASLGGAPAVGANNVAKFDTATSTWSALGAGAGNGVNGTVNALAVRGNDIFIGGEFSSVGNVPARRVARFNTLTNTWSALAQGNGNGVDNTVQALAVSGNTLFVGGNFSNVNVGGSGGTPALTANKIVRFDTATNTWSVLGQGNGNGVSGEVLALAVNGSQLFIGGNIGTVNYGGTGGTPALAVNKVAMFDTASNTWNTLARGNGKGVDNLVRALAVNGSTLYVGGDFQQANKDGSGGTPALIARRLAKFDLSTNTWSALAQGNGNGVDNMVRALALSNGSLYVGGDFTTANVGGTGATPALTVNRLVKFDTVANTWSVLAQGDGNGVDGSVLALSLGNNGLFVGGTFSTANAGGTGGTPALTVNKVVKFDLATNTWSAHTDGGGTGTNSTSRALALLGCDLFTAGDFSRAGSKTASALARYFGVNPANTAPTFASVATPSQQQGSPAANAQLVTVSDAETPAGNLTVTVTSANPANGVTISNLVNTNGTITADIVAACAAANASFTLQVSDGAATATATVDVTVTANTPPVLSYPNLGFNVGTPGSFTPNPAPSDNGSIASITVSSLSPAPAAGTITVNNTTGAISVSNTVPLGVYNVSISAVDNCGSGILPSFTLRVGCISNLLVNDLGDGPDATPGNGVCETAPGNGVCTLRAALQEASRWNCGAFAINFNVTGTLDLGTALPALTHPNLTLNGPGAAQLTVQRNAVGNFGIFRVLSGGNLTLNGLTISNGAALYGGGIDNNGVLTVNNCVISGNTATGAGGGINSFGPLTVTGSTLSGNSAVTGGGLAVGGESLNMSSSTVSGNTAVTQGGGIHLDNLTATLTNCTISGNTVTGSGHGGGLIHLVSSGDTSALTLINTTLTNNTGSNGAGLSLFSLTGAVSLSTQLKNTIVAGNQGLNFKKTGSNNTLATLGNNLDSDGTSGFGDNVQGDRVGTSGNPLNALLASLGAYGGATQTHALLPGSPAINAGTASGAPANDQRGTARVGATDMGAFESQGFTLALNGGNNQFASIGTNFASPLSVTVTASGAGEPVNGGQLTFTPPGGGASCTIAGNPASINGGIATSGAVTANATAGAYNVAAGANGVSSPSNFTLTNNAAPTVLSLVRANTSPANAASVQFIVTFSESLSGGAASNFMLAASGLTGAAITNVSGSGTMRAVTVSTGTGSGTLGLNLTDSTGLVNGSGVGLGNLPFIGQVYTIDKIGPTALITANPPNPAVSNAASFSFTGADTGGAGLAGFQCQLDGGSFVGCSSPMSYTGLSDGPHTFAVQAVDQLGNVGAAVSYPWTISTNSAPTISGATLTRTAGAGSSNSIIATVNDAQTPAGNLLVTVVSANPANGVTVANLSNTGGTITADVTAACAATNASFTLQVSDGSLTATATLTVTVSAAPALSITTQPLAQTVCAGSPVAFSVVAANAVGYQWRKDSVNINGATAATYSIPAATASDVASYEVVVTGTCGTLTSSPVSLTVNTTTSITTQPASQTKTIGQSVSLSVAAMGHNLSYQWRKGGVDLNGATASSYSIPAVALADGGSYDVVVSGTCGTQTSGAALLTVNCQSLTVTNPATTTGALNTAFSQTFMQSGGNGAVIFSLNSGVLPPGLTLAADGTLSGTPTQSGTFPLTVQATDANGCVGTGVAYTLVIQCTGLTVNPVTLPGAQLGASFNQQLTAAGGTGAVSFQVTSGVLPPGLQLGAQSGALTGTPTATGLYSFTVSATDAGGCTGARSYTVNVTTCSAITLAPATLPQVTAGVAYSQTLTVSPTGTYSFNVLIGNLPPGLNLDPQSGVLSGLATVTGSYQFTVQVLNGSCSGTQSYTLAVVCPTITLTPTSLPGATVGTAYSQSVSAAPSGNYSFAKTSGTLPSGLTLSAAGVLSGTPTATGTFTFTITATGFGTCSGSRTYTLTVAAGCTTITLPSLPATGKLGVSYYGNLAATTPSGSYTFTRDSGTLPPGLVIDNLFTALTGKPTALGTYAFTLKATRSNGCTGTRAYSITISSAQAALAQVADYDGDGQTDPALWTQASGRWSILLSGRPGQRHLEQTATWGDADDLTLLGDYDGDGRTDVAVFRPANGTWYIQRSSDGTALVKAWGAAGDVPVPGDYDGDGQTDLAIWRPSEGHWYLWRSHTQDYAVVAWGAGAAPYLDVPVPGDYDGDGKTDLAVFRRATGTWLVKLSGAGQVLIKAWGVGTDVPVAGDYDGDGRTDVAVWRGATGEWFVWRSAEQRYQITAWGAAWAGDVPAPGDYDGDGVADCAVWRAAEGRWYVRLSGAATAQTQAQGQRGDLPVAGRNTR
jgi:hypothetical protein